jgi:hypothetical protein
LEIDNWQWLHGLFDKVVTTSAAHFLDVARFDGEEATGVGAILIDAAEGGAIGSFLQKWTLENEFAARAATVAFAAPQRERRDSFFLAEVGDDEATQFALGLTRAQFRVRDLARTNPPGEACFEWERLACQSFVIS